MASLYHRNKKDSTKPKVWWTQFYVIDPVTETLKQVRKSTGKTGKKAAAIAAFEMERSAQGAITANGDKAQKAKAILAQAVSDIERETFTVLSARKHLKELLAIATGEDMPAYSLSSWLDEWLRRKARDSSDGTMARYKKSIKTFVEWLGAERSRKPLESITMSHVRKWRDTLQDEGRAGKTVNKYVKDLGSAFRSAIREGLITYNPCAALEGVSTEDSMDRKPFTTAEVISLLEAAPTVEWRGLILIAAFTGLRLGDAACLKWESIDLANQLITLVPHKTRRKKREVRIPIQTDLLVFLSQQKSSLAPEDKFVLPQQSKVRTNGRNGLSVSFNRVMETAGVDRGKSTRQTGENKTKDKGKGRVVHERGFHSLRHTFTSWLRTAGVSEEDRMALTGHSTRESHAIYSHTDSDALRKAITKLPGLSPVPPTGGDSP